MKNIIISLFALFVSANVFGQRTKILNSRKFEKATNHKEAIIIDVRTPEEFSKSHIIKSINIDWNNAEEFKRLASFYAKNVPIYLYCRTRARSEKAMTWLKENGYDRIRILNGGLEAWKKSGKEISTNNNTENIESYSN